MGIPLTHFDNGRFGENVSVVIQVSDARCQIDQTFRRVYSVSGPSDNITQTDGISAGIAGILNTKNEN